jgi:peptidoglycan/xylan/chitin deacetylase (PgdA/CDA1 family)
MEAGMTRSATHSVFTSPRNRADNRPEPIEIFCHAPSDAPARRKPGARRKSKAWLRWLWACFLLWTGAIWWANRRIAKCGGVVILSLHRVLTDAAYAGTNSPDGMLLRQDTFSKLVSLLDRKHELVSASTNCLQTIPSRKSKVAITFDDGWEDSVSATTSAKDGRTIPATVFICPEKMGMIRPFWPEQVISILAAAKRSNDSRRVKDFLRQEMSVAAGSDDSELPQQELVLNAFKFLAPIKRDQQIRKLREMAEACEDMIDDVDRTMTWFDVTFLAGKGVSFGSHTSSHEILTSITQREAAEELSRSKLAISRSLQKECFMFAYPNGSFSTESKHLVAEAGYRYAFTTEPGIWVSTTDPYAIPRTNVWEGKVVGPCRTFSPALFEYEVIWKSFRRSRGAKR